MYKATTKGIKDYNYKPKRLNYRYDESKYRNTYRWHKKSKDIRERSNYLCSVCQDEGIYTYDGVEVHHIVKLSDRPELLLEDSNLICLCKDHHKEADDNKIDKEYLYKLVKERDKI